MEGIESDSVGLPRDGIEGPAVPKAGSSGPQVDIVDIVASTAASIVLTKALGLAKSGRDGRDGLDGERGLDGRDGADGRDADPALAGRSILVFARRSFTALVVPSYSVAKLVDVVDTWAVTPHYDSATGVFTAPRDMFVSVDLTVNGTNGVGMGAQKVDFIVRKNATNWLYETITMPPDSTTFFHIDGRIIIKLVAGDTLDAVLKNNLAYAYDCKLRAHLIIEEVHIVTT